METIYNILQRIQLFIDSILLGMNNYKTKIKKYIDERTSK